MSANLVTCPWKSSRWSPRETTLTELSKYISAQPEPPTSILEIGGGVSTWYLNQLNFEHFVTVEEYDVAIENVKNYIPNVTLINKMADVPKREYQYIFIDSHVGCDPPAEGHQREMPLIYVMENNLFNKNSTLIVHDYHKVKKFRGDTTSRNGKRYKGWNETVDKYGWKIVHEIMLKRCFGVYKLS